MCHSKLYYLETIKKKLILLEIFDKYPRVEIKLKVLHIFMYLRVVSDVEDLISSPSH